ncbi:MAG: TRAP transporter large permease [Ignavibacteriales bacterium]
MGEVIIGLLGIAVLLVLLFLGMHIGAAMTFVGILGTWVLTGSLAAALGVLKVTPFTVAASFSRSVVPMFVLMGNLAFHSGISTDLYAACYRLMSRLRGGLAIATIAACSFFSAICGSSTATTVTMGVVCLPEMKKYNYKIGLTCGSICAGGTLGILIPPSVGFILYGMNAEIAVGRMFMAGILPGIVLTLCYIATVIILCRIDPEAGPMGPSFTLKERLVTLKGIVPILVLFGLVLGGVFLGWFTPNEGGAVGAAGSLAFLLLRKKVSLETFRGVVKALRDTTQTTAMVTLILIGAYLFGYFLTLSNLPATMAEWAIGLNVSPYLILALMLGVYALLGCFVDSLPLIVLLVPIFLPIVKAIGLDPIWFGVLMVMMMELGLITPPVGMVCYVMTGIAKDVPLGVVFRGTAPFVIPLIVATAIVIAFPALATWLPSLM